MAQPRLIPQGIYMLCAKIVFCLLWQSAGCVESQARLSLENNAPVCTYIMFYTCQKVCKKAIVNAKMVMYLTGFWRRTLRTVLRSHCDFSPKKTTKKKQENAYPQTHRLL
jgi:hypothetical protein